MAAPAYPNNLAVILDCYEYDLKQIENANGYRTDGVLVDRAKDPRLLKENLPEEYARKHAAITFSLTKREKDDTITSGMRRWKQHYQIQGIVTLTKDQDSQDIKLDQVVGDLQDDIVNAIDQDINLVKAAIALGLPPPNITKHQIDDFENDGGANWPDAHFIAKGSFWYTERTARGWVTYLASNPIGPEMFPTGFFG